ncbi:MAG: BlaI/MecI/CopY family transcriptional regulator, partial [Evtepia sp.]|nr:BlaI/MecI/CopY family transcriptional regulator [Evtepia sp.]
MEYHIADSEYRFMQVVWEAAPVGSGRLVELCQEKLGWKKSTTYTVLK